MSLEYMIGGKIRQVISQKINEDLAFPEKIRIVKAEYYTFVPQPRKTPWKDGTGKYRTTCVFPSWIKVWDQDGVCGEGPANPKVWEDAIPFMMGFKEPLTNLEWRKYLYWKERGAKAYQPVMSQVETLLFDIIAKKRGIPMHRLLGAKKDYCDAYKGGGATVLTDEQLVDEMKGIAAEGFKATKMKISREEMSIDIRRLALVREALGPDFAIAVDSNQAWDAETCMEFLKQVEPYNIAFWEEPIVHTQTEEIAKLVAMMKAEGLYKPLAYGENGTCMSDYQAYMDAGVEIIQPVPMMYTIAEPLRIANVARAAGHRITSGQNHMGCLMGTLLEDGEMIEFHRPNIEGVEEYYKECPKIGADGKMHMPLHAGSPVIVDFEKLKADGRLAQVQCKYC